MKRKSFFLLTLMIVICILGTGCKTNKGKYINNDRNLMSKVVYNASVKNDERFPMAEISSTESFSANFGFSSLAVYRSFAFVASFDFDLGGYLSDYQFGDPVNIIVAQIEIVGNQKDTMGIHYQTEILILNYKNQFVGCVSPRISAIDTLNPQVDKYDYRFQTSTFFVGNSIVKYYTKDDLLFSIFLSTSNNKVHSFMFDNNGSPVKDPMKLFYPTIIDSQCRKLNSEETIDLIRLSSVNRIFLEARILSIDKDNSKVYVDCKDQPSILLVTLPIGNVPENNFNFDELTEGDVLEIFYYERYVGYSPTQVIMPFIKVKK